MPAATVSAQSSKRSADVPNQSSIAVMAAEEAIYHRLNSGIKTQRRKITGLVILIWLMFSISWVTVFIHFILIKLEFIEVDHKSVELASSILPLRSYTKIFIFCCKCKDFLDGLKELVRMKPCGESRNS
jgi:hypothetical protein